MCERIRSSNGLIHVHPSDMNLDNPTTNVEPEEDLDDPNVHTVSTEEFVETVERASQEDNDEVLTEGSSVIPHSL